MVHTAAQPRDSGADSPDDVLDALRAAAAEPGGNRTPIGFSDHQNAILNTIIDELIPPGDGFPAPSSVHVVETFFTRYIAPSGSRTVHFPGAAEDTFKAALDEFAPAIEGLEQDGRVAALKELERSHPDFFGQLRALTYAGYYSRPIVVAALRANLPAARDYNGPPLPYGYDRTTADWSGLNPPEDGTFIATSDVQKSIASASGVR